MGGEIAMNTDNYIPVKLYALKKAYLDDSNRKFVELLTDDRVAVCKAEEAYNKTATILGLKVVYWVETMTAYMKPTKRTKFQ